MNILIRLLVFVVTYIVVVFTLGVVLGVIGAPVHDRDRGRVLARVRYRPPSPRTLKVVPAARKRRYRPGKRLHAVASIR